MPWRCGTAPGTRWAPTHPTPCAGGTIGSTRAGTDGHDRRRYDKTVPLNVVYARELSAAGVLEAIARGHSYLSSGPELGLEVRLRDGRTATMGDAVAAADLAEVRVSWRGAPAEARASWVVNGEEAAHWAGGQGEQLAPRPPEARWGVLELRGPDGAMLALSNPIYLMRDP